MGNIINEEKLKKLYTKEEFADILEWLKSQIRASFPQWNSLLDTDAGVVLLELFAGIADMFRFYQNVHAVEAFPVLARLRQSLVRHAKWFGYTPKPAGAARVDLRFTATSPASGATVPVGTQVATQDGSIVFETVEPLVIPPGQVTGTVGAIHAHRVANEVLGTSNGEPNQTFSLLQKPLVMLTSDDGEDQLALEVYVGGERWQVVRSLAWASELGGENGNVCRLDIDENDEARIVFGDGVFGNIPPEGATITATYWIGGGKEGNVGANTLTNLLTPLLNIASVTNPSAASGGYDRESDEELRRNIPSQVITRGRAVTRDDYRRLLLAFGEVAAVNVHHPQDNVVEVYVLPQGGGAPSEELRQKLADYLDNIRMITEDVRVLSPTLVPVDVAVKVYVATGTNVEQVHSDVYSVIRDNLSQPQFARTLYPSDIFNLVMQNVPEVVKMDLDKMARHGESGVEALIGEPDEAFTPGDILVGVYVMSEE